MRARPKGCCFGTAKRMFWQSSAHLMLATWAKGGVPHFPGHPSIPFQHISKRLCAPESSSAPNSLPALPETCLRFLWSPLFFLPTSCSIAGWLKQWCLSHVWRCSTQRITPWWPKTTGGFPSPPSRRFPLPPLAPSFLLRLKAQWLQTTEKRPSCGVVTVGIAGRGSVGGESGNANRRALALSLGKRRSFLSGWVKQPWDAPACEEAREKLPLLYSHPWSFFTPHLLFSLSHFQTMQLMIN